MLAHLRVNLSAALGNEKAAKDREVIELSMSGLEIGEAWSRADIWWQDNRAGEDSEALRGGLLGPFRTPDRQVDSRVWRRRMPATPDKPLRS